MKPSIRVLYEDRRSPGMVAEYGPHALLVACVADRLGVDRHELKARFRADPRKSNAKVLRSCQQDLLGFLDVHAAVMVVLDRVGTAALLGLAHAAMPPEIRDAWLGRCMTTERVHVSLIDPSLEALTDAARAVGGEATPARGVKLTPLERDRLLLRLAGRPASERQAVLANVPSFEEIVDLAAHLAGGKPSDTPERHDRVVP